MFGTSIFQQGDLTILRQWRSGKTINSYGWFSKKSSKSVTLGLKIKTMNTQMKPMQVICGNIVFSEFSKFLPHVSYFSEKINLSYIFSNFSI